MNPAPPVLIVAHPGHELRLFNWMERERPRVFILSDGSGSAQTSRIAYSASSIAAAGATLIEGSGRKSDRDWYAAMIAGDTATFAEAADIIAAAATHARLIVADAVDGYNPLHDLCQAMAVAVATRMPSRPELLVSPATAVAQGTEHLCWMLEEQAVQRKYAAVLAYTPLAEESTRLLAEAPDALRREQLLLPVFDWPESWEPQWETYGRKRVQEGRFVTPISYRDHVLPIAKALLGNSVVPSGRDALRSGLAAAPEVEPGSSQPGTDFPVQPG